MNDPTTAARAPRPLTRALLEPLERFLHVEAASGIVLLAATVIALAWASSPWSESYHALWHLPITLGVGSVSSVQSLHFWINDGLMTIFFRLVGLEIRREMHEGALATPRLAVLPVTAAIGGVVVPALIYLAFNSDPTLRQAWAVPTATDIAFAIGVLALLGKRVPGQLRVLLLAIAIIDDIAAILIIAFFYSSGIKLLGLVIAAAGMGLVILWQRLGAASAPSYILPGLVVWGGMLYAGVHPTLAGVILGLMTPVVARTGKERLLADADTALREFDARSNGTVINRHELVTPVQRLKTVQRDLLPPVVRVEAALHPWVAYAIIPLFALANAGVDLREIAPALEASLTLGLGIVAGLVIGKPLGIGLATWLSLRLGFATLPAGVTARGVLLIGALAGIGFTMAIFIANLAFTDAALLAEAKLAVLVASFCAAIIGLVGGRFLLHPPPPPAAAPVKTPH